MNRTMPLQSRTRLKPGTGLQRSKPMGQGAGLAQGGGLNSRRAPLSPVSARRRAEPVKRRTQRDTGPSPAVRTLVRDRDHGWCVRCGVTVGPGTGSVHHRKRRSQGGMNEPQNLILLCGTGTTACHGWVHGHPAGARVSGWLLTVADNPAVVPVTYATPDGLALFLLTADGTTARPGLRGVAA